MGIFAVLLTVLFIGLKLTGFIAWPWIAVLLPAIVSVSIGLFLIVLASVLAAIVATGDA